MKPDYVKHFSPDRGHWVELILDGQVIFTSRAYDKAWKPMIESSNWWNINGPKLRANRHEEDSFE